MAKTNFQYEKRQRELEKKRKAEEKAKRKLEAKNSRPAEDDGQSMAMSMESVADGGAVEQSP